MMLELFAQMNRGGNNFNGGGGGNFGGGGAGGGAGKGVDEAFWIAFAIGMVIVLVISLAIGILFLMTLSKCLKRCSPRNRTMEPGQVWLNLIPCFSIVWQFITVSRISESLGREFRDRGLRRDGDFGNGVGMTYCICNCLGWIPIVNYISPIVGLVCFIIYWVKIAGFSKELAEGPNFRRERYEEDDYDDRYDDRDDDRRRGRRDDYDDEPRDPPPPRGGHYDEGKDDLDDKPWRRK